MNSSELIKKLVEISKERQTRINELKGEYAELTDIERNQTSKDLRRIKEIRSELARLSNKELEEDLSYLKSLNNKLKNFKRGLNETKDDKLKKELLEEKVNELENELIDFVSGLEEKYADLIKAYDEKVRIAKEKEEAEKKAEEKPEEVKEENKTKKKINKGALTLAILAALGVGTVGYAAGKGSIKNAKNSVSTSITDIKNDTNKEIENPKTKVETENSIKDIESRITFEKAEEENYTFTDVDDEEQVAERAYEIIDSFDKISPVQNIKLDDVMDFLRYINGGVVNEVSREAALNVISQIEVLMNNEMNYGVDVALKGNSERPKQDLRVDYSKFFIDGTQASKLASKITTLRTDMLDNPTNKDKQSEEFTKLLLNSWYLNGNEEINANALETSGSAALIDKLFLNTAMIAQANPDENYEISVNMGVVDEEITLTQIIDEINKPICPTMVTADNGETFETLMNKFSSDMEGMVKEAYYNKENSNGLTLHK